MGPSVEVRLLGPVEVSVAGVPVDLGGVRQRLLVARLGLAVGRVVPTADLLELLWPDEIPDSAVGNLQSYVSRVRRRIGRELIVKDPGGYRLLLGRTEVDATRVEDEVAALAGLETRDRLEVLDAARRAWRGASLADLADWHGLVPDAVRLDDLRLRVLELWAEAVLANGQHDVCLTVLAPVAAAHPTREGLQLALMRALAGIGRVDEALRAANELRTALREATGLAPGERIIELERQLLAGPAEVGGAPRPDRIPRPPRNAFVGRDHEIDELVTLAGRPGVVEIVGPAGVGKTRLVLESLSSLPSSRPVRFVDLTQFSRQAQVHAGVAGQLYIGAADEGTVDAIADALGPDTLLILDNCEHVADGVVSLVQAVSELRRDVTIVCTSRRRLAIDGVSLTLAPLPSADALTLFEDRARGRRSDFSLSAGSRGHLAVILAATDGLPLAVELLSARERVLGLDQLARHVELVDGPSPVEDLLPELLASLDGSYRLLPEAARALFRGLSVVPGSFGLGVVEALSPQPITNLGDLVDACLVTVDHGPEVRYRLLYPVRAIGLHHLGPAEAAAARAAVSGWVLRSMEAARQDQNDRLPGPTAYLRRESAIIDSCVDWLVEAGRPVDAARLAVDVSLIATDEPSSDWLQRLGSLADDAGGDDGDDEAAALWALAGAGAAWIGGDIGRCDELLARAGPALGGDHPLGWYVDFVETVVAVYRADARPVTEHARQVVADRRAPAFLRATALCAAALAHSYTGREVEAAEVMALAPDLLDEVGRVDGFVDFTRAELCRRDDPDRAGGLLERARELCAAAEHSYNHRVASIAQLALDVRQGRLDRAAGLAAEVLEACCRAGMWPQAWIVTRLTAELLVARGRHLEAAVLLRAADGDRSAPAVVGEDAGRLADLRADIETALSRQDRSDVDRLSSALDRSGLPGFVTAALAA